MLVCHCADITEEEIKEAIKLDCIEDLYYKGMMQHCGSCREDIREIYEEGEEDESAS